MAIYEKGFTQKIIIKNGEKIVDDIINYENKNGKINIYSVSNGNDNNNFNTYPTVLQNIILKNKNSRFRNRELNNINYKNSNYSSSENNIKRMTHSSKKTARKLKKRSNNTKKIKNKK
jgi:hypothetical protein